MAVIIIPTTYDAASPDAVSALNGNTYGYDANGNQTTRTIGGVTSTLGYDAEGRLVSVTAASMPPTPTPGPSPTPAGATPTPTSTNTPTATPTPGATSTPVPDLLFADGFESGNTSAWSTAVTDGGDLSVSTASARFGTYGLQAVINDTTSIYVRKVFGGTENHVTARLYLDPNSVTIPSGQSFTILQLADATGVSVRVQLKNNAGAYQVVAEAQNDAGAYTTGQYQTISDTWQMVEVEWQTASAAGANDGYVKMWLNDLLVDTLSGLDNDTRNVTKAVIGAAAGLDAGTAGMVYWDGFEARRGSHIGPMSFGPASKALAAPLRVSLAASFVYDGDGKRVAQTINGVTTYFVGSYFEKTGSAITKYYYAGSQRVAMRTGSTVYYLLSDHLGSTSLTTDSSGNVVSELRYSAWGSVRYQAGSSPSEYTFTGQYGYDFGLMYFNARWLDVYLNHFTQPDTIVPDPYNSQDWDRYSYARNNPLKYTDPTGHDVDCGIGDQFCSNLKHEMVGSDWQKHLSSKRFMSARDAYYYYYNHPDKAIDADLNQGGDEEIGLSYSLGSIYAEDVLHRAFQPYGMDTLFDRIDTARQSDDFEIYWGLMFGFGLQEWMDSDDKGGSGGSSISTGRVTPRNLKEQLAMEATVSDPSAGIVLPITMTDPRWPASQGWVKMSQNVNGVEIHYVYNTKTGLFADFKFK